jgi:hypothetical protein
MRTRSDLIGLLSPSIGVVRATTAVENASQTVGVAGDDLSRADALRILEEIADVSGIVGVAARFAKSRVHLIWEG